jgi:hypothetical protein
MLARMPQPSAGPVDDKELKRRIRHLANHAQHGEFGKAICPICSTKSNTEGTLQRHLKAKHADEIRAIGPEQFA